jgi:hypothetical protein
LVRLHLALQLPPHRHALRVVPLGFFGLHHRARGLRSTTRHRSPSKAGPLWECRGAPKPLAPVPAGAKAPGNGSHVPQTLGMHLSMLPNPSLSTDPLRQAVLPVRRAGLCCTTRASRPASAVGVSSNVRPRLEEHVACQQSQRLRREPNSHEAAKPPLLLHECRRLVSESWRILRGTNSPQPRLVASVAHRNNQLRPSQCRSISHLSRRTNRLSASLLRGAAAGSRSRQTFLAQLLPQQQRRKFPHPVRPQSYGRGLTPRSAPDPLRQAVLPARRAGLCCTTRASRPASAVGVSSNVRRQKCKAPRHL